MKYRRLVMPLSPCSYLPTQTSRMVYAEAGELSSQEYLELINQRWRRFGFLLFRPECPNCSACEPIRVPVREYKPNRNQRRIMKQNASLLRLEIAAPRVDEVRIQLYVDHHNHHSETRGWHKSDRDSALQGILNFTVSPLPVEEWAYYLDDKLVAVAYIDRLPDGLSGIYFYHSPEQSKLSLGNWICISMILKAQEMNLDYIYFGYYVKGNISMEYKANFLPNQVLRTDGKWHYFLT